MSTSHRYTSADLAAMPYAEGVRYEIIDGELHVSTMPHWRHQYACNQIGQALGYWSRQAGGLTLQAPGLIFSPDNDVAPDVVWVSRERLAATENAAGHLRSAPEIVVESSRWAAVTNGATVKPSLRSIRVSAFRSTG